jgi:hypothetical protein
VKLTGVEEGTQNRLACISSGSSSGSSSSNIPIEETGLPNANAPSDHLPIEIVVELYAIEDKDDDLEDDTLSIKEMESTGILCTQVHRRNLAGNQLQNRKLPSKSTQRI